MTATTVSVPTNPSCEAGWLTIDGVRHLVYVTPTPECRVRLVDEEGIPYGDAISAPFDFRPEWWPRPPQYIIDFFSAEETGSSN